MGMKINKNHLFAYPDLGKLYLLLSRNLKINYKNILFDQTNNLVRTNAMFFPTRLDSEINKKLLSFNVNFSIIRLTNFHETF